MAHELLDDSILVAMQLSNDVGNDVSLGIFVFSQSANRLAAHERRQYRVQSNEKLVPCVAFPVGDSLQLFRDVCPIVQTHIDTSGFAMKVKNQYQALRSATATASILCARRSLPSSFDTG